MLPSGFAWLNAEGKARHRHQIDSIIEAAEHVLGPRWCAILVCEADKVACEEDVKADSGDSEFKNYRVFRHWPGVGSFALKAVVNSNVAGQVKCVQWLGRCGRLDFIAPALSGSGSEEGYSIVFVHDGHGDAWEESIDHAAELFKMKPRGPSGFWVGDFQVDRRKALEMTNGQ